MSKLSNAVGAAAIIAIGAVVTTIFASHVLSQDASGSGNQQVLGPGAYIYQTRVRNATCGDDYRTGYVNTFYAAIDGIPEARTLNMTLLNSRYWPRWTLTVTGSDEVVGEADVARQDNRPPDASSSFEVSRERGRFVGRGSRVYMKRVNGTSTRCRVGFDVLLRRLDD